MLNLALHAASGIVLAIVAIELMPEVKAALAGWWLALAFAGGGGAYLLVQALIRRSQQAREVTKVRSPAIAKKRPACG
ncbi:MAG: hypothetical protein KIT82_21915 [Bradyrhizobium sp.]|nr:hypothetical protein [Bradyrhizobium sp.]